MGVHNLANIEPGKINSSFMFASITLHLLKLENMKQTSEDDR